MRGDIKSFSNGISPNEKEGGAGRGIRTCSEKESRISYLQGGGRKAEVKTEETRYILGARVDGDGKHERKRLRTRVPCAEGGFARGWPLERKNSPRGIGRRHVYLYERHQGDSKFEFHRVGWGAGQVFEKKA